MLPIVFTSLDIVDGIAYYQLLNFRIVDEFKKVIDRLDTGEQLMNVIQIGLNCSAAN